MAPLAKLINICITSGTFPVAWKEAKATALHKENNKADKNNYRPISVHLVLSTNTAWPLCARSLTVAGSARSSAAAHNLRPKSLRMAYHRDPYISPSLFLVFINDLSDGVSQPTTVEILLMIRLRVCFHHTQTHLDYVQGSVKTRGLEDWSRNNRSN